MKIQAIGISSRQTRILREYALHLFKQSDQDRSGTLQVDEFADILGKLGHPVSHEQAKDLLSKVDADGSGSLDIDEFFLVFGSQDKEDHLVEGRPCFSFSLSGSKSGNHEIDIEIGKVECLCTEEPLSIAAVFANSLKECIHGTGSQERSSSDKACIAQTITACFSPFRAVMEDLHSTCNSAWTGEDLISATLHLHGFELGFILDSQKFATDCLFVNVGSTKFNINSTTESPKLWRFHARDLEIGMSLPHTRVGWDCILQPLEIEISQIFSKECEESVVDIKIEDIVLSLKMAQLAFITHLIDSFALKFKPEISKNTTHEHCIEGRKLMPSTSCTPKPSECVWHNKSAESKGCQVGREHWRLKSMCLSLHVFDDSA